MLAFQVRFSIDPISISAAPQKQAHDYDDTDQGLPVHKFDNYFSSEGYMLHTSACLRC